MSISKRLYLLTYINMAFTKEKLESIRYNLKKAFGVDYIPVSTKIKKLYKDRKFIPLKGDMLYIFLPFENKRFGLKQGWHRLKVTYVRSGVVFFKYIDSKHNRTEDHADLDSIFIQEANVGVIRLKDINIPEQNLPLIKFEQNGCPFDLDIKTK
jgi:hypothetical protein